MSCRECELFNIEAAKDKAGRVRKANAVACLWKSTEPYPISVFRREVRPKAGFVTCDMGEGCPCFQERR